jgi:hypothetical protein
MLTRYADLDQKSTQIVRKCWLVCLYRGWRCHQGDDPDPRVTKIDQFCYASIQFTSLQPYVYVRTLSYLGKSRLQGENFLDASPILDDTSTTQ